MLLRPSMNRLFSAVLLAGSFIGRYADGSVPPAVKHERDEVTLFDVKYSLFILEVLQRLMIYVRFYGVFRA